MLPLRDLQGAMAASVLQGIDVPLAPIVRADGIAFDSRLQVYRNNTLSSLTAALKDSFPVVCQLVDERFFGYAAQEYIRTHPPRAPRLAEYGGDFAEFLAGFQPVRHLPYLPDVARLDPARIAAVPQDRYARLTFVAHPAVRLFASEFPVDRIWQAHQPGGDLETRIDLSSGGCRLLIDRHEQDIRFLALDAAGFALAAALCAGATLQEAYEKGAAVDEAFDLIAALSMHLARGTFADFIGPTT
jgi:Putative DNA-binding domain